MKTGYLVFVCFFFLGLVLRGIYEHLKKNGRVDSNNRIVFAVVFAAMCLLWASWFNMCALDPYPLTLYPVVRWIGFGAFLTGFVLALGALVQLRGVENINHLVTKGLFSKFRHPMYAGFILWIVGYAVFHGAMMSLVLGVVAIGNILYWQALEEKELESKYGERYSNYKKRTWF